MFALEQHNLFATVSPAMSSNDVDLPIPPVELKRVNPFMLNASALQILKPVEKHRFTEENFTQDDSTWKKNATERMRAIDDARMRAPTDKECSELNIPNDRLNLHSVKSVLLLCGGCVGVRFSSEELQLLETLTAACETTYKKVDTSFKAMPQKSRTRRLKGPYDTNCVIPDTADNATTAVSPTSPASRTSEVAAESGEDVLSVSSPCTTSFPPTDSEKTSVPENIPVTEEDADIIQLHLLIDSYLGLIRQLQIVVKMKNEKVPSDADRTERDILGKDPELILGKGHPAWLSTLISKYEKYVIEKQEELEESQCAQPVSVSRKAKSTVTVSKLSTFLGSCAVGLIPCRSEEREAFVVLLQASNDSRHKYAAEEEDPVTFIRKVQEFGEYYSVNTEKYFASRFFDFLSQLTELKSMPH